MSIIVADTSALVSLGIIVDHTYNPLNHLLDTHDVIVPEQVIDELRETASYTDVSGKAAQAVLNRHSQIDVQPTDLDEDFPLDDGENAAVTLANELDATQLLCDEFNRLALIHASLADIRLMTTPILLTTFVHNDILSPENAEDFLNEMSDARSWKNNTYVAQAKVTLQQVCAVRGRSDASNE
jgi:predicted nucleic acid-binding protein